MIMLNRIHARAQEDRGMDFPENSTKMAKL